jgi:glutaconate CoA-transferase subunit A
MSVVAALRNREPVSLDLITFLGGPDIDILAAFGRVRSVAFSYVGWDVLGLAPHFRQARESAAVKATEYSERTFLLALRAAAERVPFMPTRSPVGTDLMTVPNSPYTPLQCPITGQLLAAVSALQPDVAFIHVNIADRLGNGVICGDTYADPLLARASRRVVLTAERLVDRLSKCDIPSQGRLINRSWVTDVCEEPGGAGFTSLPPEIPTDFGVAREYLRRVGDLDWLTDVALTGRR